MTMLTASRRTALRLPRPNAEQRLILHEISWQSYKTICAAVERPRLRMTYAEGTLEIMVVSTVHDGYGSYFGLIIFTLARYFRIKVRSCGSFTHQRDDIEKGFEPDRCFYLASLPRIKGKKELDLSIDPPPDLMIEVDVSRSSMDRMSIFAAFGVPEVWRFDTKTIRVYVLNDGSYNEVLTSPTFPEVPVSGLVKFLELGFQEDNITMVEELEKWLAGLEGGKRKGKLKGRGRS